MPVDVSYDGSVFHAVLPTIIVTMHGMQFQQQLSCTI